MLGLHILWISPRVLPFLRGSPPDIGFRPTLTICRRPKASMQSKTLPDAQKDYNEHLRDTKGYHVEPNYCHAGSNEHPRDTKGHPLEPNCCHVGSMTMKATTSICGTRKCTPRSLLLPCRLEEVWRAAAGRLHWIVLAGMRLVGGRRPPWITASSRSSPAPAVC